MASEQHQTPSVDMECLCCMEDITDELQNYAEYKEYEDSPWQPALFCIECIERLKLTLWNRYVEGVNNPTCRADLRALLADGPPINVYDANAMACPNKTGHQEISYLWSMQDGGKLVSPKLEGSLTGDERMNYWEERKRFWDNEMKKPDLDLPE